MMPHSRRANSRSVRTSRLLRWISSLLLFAGSAALAYASYVVVSAWYFQVTEAAKFDALAVRPTLRPAPRAVVHGSVIGMLEIPRLSISAIVVQGDSNDVLSHAVGHIPGTPLPGQPGNVALAGHRDTIFRPLRKITAGDVIELRTDAGAIRYRVSSTKIVPPSDVAVLESRGQNELTLVTCYPFYYVGHAPDRFIVTASEVAPPLH
jgi:sortase A